MQRNEKRGWGQKDLVTFLLHTHTHTSPLYIDQQQHQHRRRHFVICLHCTRIVIGPRHTLDLMNCVPMHQQRNCWFRRIPASWNFEPIYLLNTDISIWYQCNISITKSLAHISDIILRGWTDISPRGHPGPINFTGYQSFIIAKHSTESATCSVFALGSGQWSVIMFTRFSSC